MSAAGVSVRVLSLTFAEDAAQNAQQVNAREVARRLDPARFEVSLLSSGDGPSSIAALSHVRLVRLPRRGRAAAILARLLTRRFDLLLYPGPGLPESVFLRLPRWFGPRARSRVLMPVEGDVRQLDEVPAWIRRRVDRLHRRADALFPITEHVAERLRERCGRAGEVVPVGVDLEAFRPRSGPRRPGPPRVLCVGTVKAWKRPELARRAAEAFPAADFTWAGEGETRSAEAGKAPRNLAFPGHVPRERLPELYRDADVFLHPSRMEGLPKVLLEALASGLPAIAFDDYRPRFVEEGGAGFVVKDEAGMLGALRRLLEDASLRERAGLAARRVAEAFSWDAVAARWAAIFEREAALARGAT